VKVTGILIDRIGKSKADGTCISLTNAASTSAEYCAPNLTCKKILNSGPEFACEYMPGSNQYTGFSASDFCLT
jgi:hypothetical protein